MNLLQLVSGHKSFAARSLFRDASFSVNAGEHIGVIGPNGAGKTTLFKILMNEESLDSGEVVKKKGLRVGYLKQIDDWPKGTLLETYVMRESQIPIWEMKSLGKGLGLEENHFNSEMDSLSGGYRTRAKLLYLLGCKPDLLLLDEPTNYLDLESTLVLESFLQDTQSAFLLISHDREFLRRTTDHILEVESGDMTKFNGNLDDYFEQKTLLQSQLKAQALSQSQKRQQILDFVSRFGAKASKARQAQSRLKQLEKMEAIDFRPIPQTAQIRIPAPSNCGKQILKIDNATLGYENKIVLDQVNLTLERGDHVAVVGVNGAGKSTLLKTISQKLSPLKGTSELGRDVRIGYYAQHVATQLNPTHTVLESLHAEAAPDVSQQEILNMAGSLLFSGDDAHKKISVLSGGEKSRVALGQILLKKCPMIVLDEPTNHLDFQTVEALTTALNNYEGTVVVVSHDRGFVGRVGTKILEINKGRVFLYPGTYDEYVWSQQKGILKSEDPASNAKNKASPNNSAAPDKNSFFERKQHSKDIQKIEKTLSLLEQQILTLNSELETILSGGTDAQRENKDKTREILAKLATLQIEKEELENKWLKMQF